MILRFVNHTVSHSKSYPVNSIVLAAKKDQRFMTDDFDQGADDNQWALGKLGNERNQVSTIIHKLPLLSFVPTWLYFIIIRALESKRCDSIIGFIGTCTQYSNYSFFNNDRILISIMNLVPSRQEPILKVSLR